MKHKRECSLLVLSWSFKQFLKKILHPLSIHVPEPDPETKDDFPVQDLHKINNLSLMGPCFHPDYEIDVTGYDPFSLFSYGSGLDDLELMSIELESGCMGHGCVTNISNTFVGVSALDSFVHVDDPTRLCKPMGIYLPYEGSCVMGENGIKKNNENACKGKKKINSLKRKWTKEEDRVLKQLVEKYGETKWSHIAQRLKGKIGKQCRERWHNHLRANIKKDVWTEEEDIILTETHAQVGNKWSEIAKKLPGRTDNSIKNHWNATIRKQYTRHNCRSKCPNPSLILQNYIKNLNLQCGKSLTNKTKIDNTVTTIEHKYYSSNSLMIPNFDFNELPKWKLASRIIA